MRGRRGSALLIVLGFLSFMVVSAVAFSIYMRSERVPSSVFRRNVTIRHLMHAGLAQAMSELDDAIRNDPFPGVPSTDPRKARGNWVDNESDAIVDFWLGRVFMPPNPDEKGHKRMAPEDETVSVFNLEGLGYVPPPLINDVRFLGRRTWTAKWRNFDYASGRYAYCAVNVSDYLDINRMIAAEPRSSDNRVSLMPMFRNSVDSLAVNPTKAKRFQNNFLGSLPSGDANSSWKLVSMLDYALANQNGRSGFDSYPFYKWIDSSSYSTLYRDENDDAQLQMFVTDSWYPPDPDETAAGSAVIDLNNRSPEYSASDRNYGQPFSSDFLRKDNRKSLRDCAMLNTPFFQRVSNGSLPSGSPVSGSQNKSLTYVDAALLKDYLDRDDTPTSLALPCVERVPMVAAMGISSLNVDISLIGTSGSPSAPVPAPGGGTMTTVLTDFKLSSAAFRNNNTLTAAIVFPFKRAKEINQTFTARALMRVFLVDESASGLRISGSPLENMRPSDDADWNDGNPPAPFTLRGLSSPVPPFMFTLVSRPVTINTAKDIDTQEDVAIGNDSGHSVTFRFDAPNGYDSQVVLTKKVDTVTPAATPAAPVPTGVSQPPEYCINVSPFAANGELVETAANHWMKESDFITSFGSRKFTLHAAAWIIIENSNGDVVDLVPAIAEDDNLYNDIGVDFVRQQGYDGTANGTPVFRFRGPSQAAFDVTASSSPLSLPPGAWTPASYCAVDPRFNYAPEDWLPRSTAVTGDEWVKWVTGKNTDNGTDSLLAEDGRDSDVFMFVSNQGVLQSMGELAFLPRVTGFGNQSAQGASTPGDLLRQTNGRMNGAERGDSANWSAIAHADIVWRTYRPYESAGAPSDYLMNFRNYYSYQGEMINTKAFRDVGDRGVRINPYSDERIAMCAFAYTPYDWWAAGGTNTCSDSSLQASSNSKDTYSSRKSRFREFHEKYTFSSSSDEAEMSDQNLKGIASAIRSNMIAGNSVNWQNAYDSLDWYGDGEVDPANDDSFRNFLGVNLDDPLYGVDRKFLYSYWRGCFANRQQLFLVFVRAESMALGGSGEGQIPPQQGGRAVALVWRDPQTPKNGGQDYGNANPEQRKPHRMRVLFYHQLD